MSLVRPIVLYTMRYDIQFKAKHIEGTNNQIFTVDGEKPFKDKYAMK
jgi:hypothetical protein